MDSTAFDPGTGLVFNSNVDGTLTVIREEAPDKFSVVENVLTQKEARTMAIDPETHDVLLVRGDIARPAPPPTAEHPHPQPTVVPDSFVILVFGK